MNFKRVHEENREIGHYYAEDHGAGVYGVFFKGKRQRKYRYIAAARDSVESVQKRIDWHISHVAMYGVD